MYFEKSQLPWAGATLNCDWLASVDNPLKKAQKVHNLSPLQIYKRQTETTRPSRDASISAMRDSNLSFWIQPAQLSQTIGVDRESQDDEIRNVMRNRYSANQSHLDMFRQTSRMNQPSDLRWNAPLEDVSQEINNVLVFSNGNWSEQKWKRNNKQYQSIDAPQIKKLLLKQDDPAPVKQTKRQHLSLTKPLYQTLYQTEAQIDARLVECSKHKRQIPNQKQLTSDLIRAHQGETRSLKEQIQDMFIRKQKRTADQKDAIKRKLAASQARQEEIDRQTGYNEKRKQQVLKITRMIEGQHNIDRKTKYINKLKENWDNRPPTQDSNPIYDDNDNVNFCKDFFNTRDSDRQSQERASSVLAGAQLAFLDIQKNQSALTQYKTAEKIQNQSPALSYLEKIAEQSVFPRATGFDFKKQHTLIDTKHQNLSARAGYIDAFACGLGVTNNLLVLNLRDTKLGDQELIKLLSALTKNIQKLDLSCNPAISKDGYHSLCNMVLDEASYALTDLSLEQNRIDDEILQILFAGIKHNTILLFLNLSRNYITEVGAELIGSYLARNETLRVLFLHWNYIGGRGSLYLSKSLLSNETLQVLDLSFCNIGTKYKQDKNLLQKKRSVSAAPGKDFKKGKTKEKEKDKKDQKGKKGKKGKSDKQTKQDESLSPQPKLQTQQQFNETLTKIMEHNYNRPTKHLTLDLTQAKSWAITLQNNKTLLHLDLSHNNLDRTEIQLIADALVSNQSILGIHLMGNEGEVDTAGFVTALPDDCNQDIAKHMLFTRIHHDRKFGTANHRLKAVSKCWICEGWSEVEFNFTPPVKIDSNIVPVKLHLQSEAYQGELLQTIQSTPQVYATTRILPPGRQKYYFTVDDQVTANQFGESNEQNNKEIVVPRVNFMQQVIKSEREITVQLLEQMEVLPRAAPKQLVGFQRGATPWDFFSSVFAKYVPDDEQKLQQCFEEDWKQTRLDSLIKKEDQIIQVKSYLRKNYKYIRDTYKYFAGLEPIGRLPCIGSQTFITIVSSCPDLVDGKYLKVADCDLEFAAANSIRTDYQYFVDRQLVRFKFLEAIVRLALSRNYKSKLCDSVIDAVQFCFQDHIIPFFKDFDCHPLRIQRFWRQENDIVFKRLDQIIKALYDKFSGKYLTNKNKISMSIEEFCSLMEKGRIYSDKFGASQIMPLFNISLMTQVNELEQDRFISMQMVEFYEALCRVADKIPDQNLQDYYPTQKTVSPFNLDKKIESLIISLGRNALPQALIFQLEKKYTEQLQADYAGPKQMKVQFK